MGGVLGHGDVQRGGDLARVHADRLGFAGGVGGDRADRRGAAQRGGDERAAALPAFEQASLFQALVDGADGVDVQAAGPRHLAQARQALSGLDLAVVDARRERPAELQADGNVGVAVDRRRELLQATLTRRRELVDGLGREVVLRLNAHISTVAPRTRKRLVCWSTSTLAQWQSAGESLQRHSRRPARRPCPLPRRLLREGMRRPPGAR